MNTDSLVYIRYPSCFNGVIVKSNQSHGSHSDYNQDLHQHALIFEMGGVDNSIEKVRLAADYLLKLSLNFIMTSNN